MNFFDLIVFVFAIIFILTAFLRGFIKEIFSLFNWVMATFLSLFLTPYASKLLAIYIKSQAIIGLITSSLIFIIVFFIVALSTSNLCKSLKEKIPKYFDRSLGVLYGILKTLIIFGFVYSVTSNLYGSLLGDGKKSTEGKKMPLWLSQAETHNILRVAAEVVDPLVKVMMNSATKSFGNILPESGSLDDKIGKVIGEDSETSDLKDLESLSDQELEEFGSGQDSGYSKKQIEKMNRLIDIINN